MVPGVLPAPEGVGRQRHQAAQDPDQIIDAPRSEEGAMPAIMLDDENTDKEPRRNERQWYRDPSGHHVHRSAGPDKPAQRGQKLRQTPQQYRRFE